MIESEDCGVSTTMENTASQLTVRSPEGPSLQTGLKLVIKQELDTDTWDGGESELGNMQGHDTDHRSDKLAGSSSNQGLKLRNMQGYEADHRLEEVAGSSSSEGFWIKLEPEDEADVLSDERSRLVVNLKKVDLLQNDDQGLAVKMEADSDSDPEDDETHCPVTFKSGTSTHYYILISRILYLSFYGM